MFIEEKILIESWTEYYLILIGEINYTKYWFNDLMEINM